MASGHVNRIKRPNTWLQRPMLQNREESSCQTGAVHTWQIVLKNSKIAGLRKTRKCSALAVSAAARLRRKDTSAGDRFREGRK